MLHSRLNNTLLYCEDHLGDIDQFNNSFSERNAGEMSLLSTAEQLARFAITFLASYWSLGEPQVSPLLFAVTEEEFEAD